MSADEPLVVRAQVFLHTAPDMTHEPTAEEIEERLLDHWVPAKKGRYFRVADMLEARAALMDAKRGPRVQRPAVFLPDNGQWTTGMTVEVRRIDNVDTDDAVVDGLLSPSSVNFEP